MNPPIRRFLFSPNHQTYFSIRVAHDLVICGFGGSCPATQDAQEASSALVFAALC
jgi:hypothetical protein